jgi:hypothetical protein
MADSYCLGPGWLMVACARLLKRGTLHFAGHNGSSHVAFQGRLSTATKLQPGRYTVLITATNNAGTSSTSHQLAFTIARQAHCGPETTEPRSRCPAQHRTMGVQDSNLGPSLSRRRGARSATGR